MSTVSAALGNAGVELSVTHNGRVFPASRLTQKKKAEFEQRLRSRALAAVMAMKPTMSTERPRSKEEALAQRDEYNAQMAIWRDCYNETVRDIASGAYAFHGSVAIRAMQEPGGSVILASVLFSCTEDELFDLLLVKNDEISAILEQIFAESAAPNLPTPAST